MRCSGNPQQWHQGLFQQEGWYHIKCLINLEPSIFKLITLTDDLCIGLHVTMGLGQSESFIIAARHHEELDGRWEVIQLLEKPAKNKYSHMDRTTTSKNAGMWESDHTWPPSWHPPLTESASQCAQPPQDSADGPN